MRKIIATALASVTAAGAVLATAAPAQADDYRYYRHHKRDGGNDAAAAAIIGGVAGLALGAAIAGSNKRDRGYYDDSYRYDRRGYGAYGYDYRYDRPYARSHGYGYGDRYGYYDRPRYRTCISRDRVWDPYIGRRVTIERSYAC